MNNKVKGAFGGLYNWQVIKELRSELAMKSLMLAAVVEAKGMSQDEVEKISSAYMRRQHDELKKQS